MLISTVSTRPSTNSAKIESFVAMAKSRTPKAANGILMDIDECTLTTEDRSALRTAVLQLCDERRDSSLPKGIEATLLRALGVSVITEITEYDWVSSESVGEIQSTLLRTLGYVEGVSIEELEAIASSPLDAVLNSDGSVVSHPYIWDISHDLPVLFGERVERWSMITYEYGTSGDLFLDWLPGVTTFNKETAELSNFSVTLLPHGHTPLKRPGMPHLRGQRMRARVVDGKLVDAHLLQVEGGPLASVEVEPCWCPSAIFG